MSFEHLLCQMTFGYWPFSFYRVHNYMMIKSYDLQGEDARGGPWEFWDGLALSEITVGMRLYCLNDVDRREVIVTSVKKDSFEYSFVEPFMQKYGNATSEDQKLRLPQFGRVLGGEAFSQHEQTSYEEIENKPPV